MEFKAYHGTTLSNAKSILKDRHFTYKRRVNHWLGNGAYFFIEDRDAAKWWSSCIKDQGKKAVLSVDIQIDESDLLDLDSMGGSKEFMDFYNDLKDAPFQFKFTEEEQDFIHKHPKEKNHVIWSKILELYMQLNPYRACCRTFEVNVNKFKIEEIGFYAQERQLNIKDQQLIDFDRIELMNV